MGLNIDQILMLLENNTKTAEDIFAQGLQEVPVAEPSAPQTEVVEVAPVIEETSAPIAESVAEPVAETVVEPVVEVAAESEVSIEEPTVKTAEELESEKTAELQKEAAELDAKGRIMARAFMNEIEKLAGSYLSETADQVQIEEPVLSPEVEKTAQVKILTDLYKQIYG